MRPEDVREFVRRQPFQPFRVKLSDGQVFEVHHPDMAMLGRGSVTIGVPRPDDPDRFYDRLITVSMYHIVLIEPIEPNKAAANGSS